MKKNLIKIKKGIVSEALPWIIISLAILAILMISIFVFREKGESLIDTFGGLFKRR